MSNTRQEDCRECPDELEVKPCDDRDVSELAAANEQLRREIEHRKNAQEALSRSNSELEERIRERTSELVSTNEDLKIRIREKTQAEHNLRKSHKRLQSLASELSLAEERQRRIIANELNERLGQVLAICKMKAADITEKARSTEFREPLEEILNLISGVIQDTRFLTRELTPPVLYEFGVVAAIEWLAEQVEQRYHVEFELDVSGKIGCEDLNFQILLYQSVRELIMNCVKHARAKKISVALRNEGQRARVQVRDDGVGFDPMFMEWSDGFGLFAIRERLQFIGGELLIDSEPGRGTRVTILVPVRASSLRRRASDKI